MNDINELYQQLLNAKDIAEQQKIIDSLIISPAYKFSIVLKNFFFHTNIKKMRLYLINKLSEYNDRKSLRHMLLEFYTIKDSDLRIAVLRTIKKLSDPYYSHRLISIYKTTAVTEKKILILETLQKTGVNLFTDFFIENFEKENKRVCLHILIYLLNTNNLNEEGLKKLFPKLEILFRNAHSSEEKNFLLTNFYLLIKNYDPLVKKFAAITDKSALKNSYLFYLAENKYEKKEKNLSIEKTVNDLCDPEGESHYTLRFSNTKIERLLTPLKNRILSFEKRHNAGLNILLEKLIYFNNTKISEIIISCLQHSANVSYKKIILQKIIFYPLTDEQKKDLQQLCLQLFQDKEHSRIFETLTMVIIVLYRHEGFKKIENSIRNTTNDRQKDYIINGIIITIRQFGYNFVVSDFDQYYLNLIIGHTITYLKNEKPAGTRIPSRLFKLIAILKNDSYAEEMMELCTIYNPDSQMLKALLSLATVKIYKYILSLLDRYADEPIAQNTLIRAVLDQLCEQGPKQSAGIQEQTLLRILSHPLFTADIIRYLHTFKNFHYTETVLKYIKVEKLEIRYQLIMYLSKMPRNQQYLNELRFLLKNSDLFIAQSAGLLICKSGNYDLTREIYNFFMISRRSFREVRFILRHLPENAAVIKTNFNALQSLNQIPLINKLSQEIKELSYRHFSLTRANNLLPEIPAPENRSGELDPVFDRLSAHIPEDAQKAIQTAEAFYSYVKKQIKAPGHKPDDYHLFSIINEYYNFIYTVIKSIIDRRLARLLNNQEFHHSLTNIFKNAYNFINFFKRENLWENIIFNKTVINELIRLILEKKENELKQYLNNTGKQLHLLAMVLNHNTYYSLTNPMQMPLEIIDKYKPLNSLYELNTAFASVKNNKTQVTFAEVTTIRNHALNIARFVTDYFTYVRE